MAVSLDELMPRLQHQAKLGVARTALVALGVGFEFLSRHSEEMQREIADWEEGRTLAIGVLPRGPRVTIRKGGRQLEMLGGDAYHADGAELKVMFKNVDAALLVLTGRIGAHTAFAEHRALVHGEIAKAMQANRAMAIVVKYLFPGVMLRSITRRMPVFSASELLLKARLYAVIGPFLARGLFK